MLKHAGVQNPGPSEVRQYLIAHPGLADLALMAAGMARSKWDWRTQLSFEMFRDPDAFDEYLVLYVRQSYYSETIMEEIEHVSQAIETHLSRCSGWLLVTTDFSSPR